jgi:hypothetical protein
LGYQFLTVLQSHCKPVCVWQMRLFEVDHSLLVPVK